MKKIASLVAGLLILTATQVNAGSLWQLEIFAKWGGISQRLVLGMAGDATDGYDPAYEVYALFWGGEPVRAYFYHTGWSPTSNYYWRDIRAADDYEKWHFYVEIKQEGSVEISWNTAYVPENSELILREVDENGNTLNVVNLQEEVSLSFYGVPGSRHHFIVTYKNLNPFLPPTINSASLRGRYVTLSLTYDESNTAEIEVYRIIPRGEATLVFKGLPASSVVRDRLDRDSLLHLREKKRSIYYRAVARSTNGEKAESSLLEVKPPSRSGRDSLASAR